jgi:hypothetical protein
VTASQTGSGCGFPLCFDGDGFAVIDDLTRRAIRRFADEDAVHRRRRLQPRRRVHDIPRRHPFARLRPRTEIDQRLTSVHRDPHLHALLLTRPVTDCQRRPHGPLRIVLVRHRRTEQRHHRIADELFYRPAETLQFRAQPHVVRMENRLDVLWIELLRPRRESHQVGKQDGDNLSLPTRVDHAPSLGRVEEPLHSPRPPLPDRDRRRSGRPRSRDRSKLATRGLNVTPTREPHG